TSLTAIVCISISGPSMPAFCGGFPAGETPARPATRIGEGNPTDFNSGAPPIQKKARQLKNLPLGGNTRFLKVRPGDAELSSSTVITPAAMAVGDRVSSRGVLSPEKNRLSAEAVIVMSKADIRQKQEQDEREWSTRGIAGIVRELRPDSAEIILEVYG